MLDTGNQDDCLTIPQQKNSHQALLERGKPQAGGELKKILVVIPVKMGIQ